MYRIIFEKTGNAIWMSHLDLMRLFQRAFRRAGLALKHTQGYNPHAFVSIALPLSVGTSSRCEVLDFDLAHEATDLAAVAQQLNAVLPAGIRCLQSYEGQRKVRELTHLQVAVSLEYDKGIPEGAQTAIEALFAQDTLIVEKRSKKGMIEQDILPMIRSNSVSAPDATTLRLDAVICAQNPSLNPDLLAKAITVHLPQFAPDFAKSTRIEVLDDQLNPYR